MLLTKTDNVCDYSYDAGTYKKYKANDSKLSHLIHAAKKEKMAGKVIQ